MHPPQAIAVADARIDEKPPEWWLWKAVLADALALVAGQRSATSHEQLRAYVWIYVSTRRGLGSFPWVCEVLGLEPSAVRRAIGDERGH